jgi:hypothetical protein
MIHNAFCEVVPEVNFCNPIKAQKNLTCVVQKCCFYTKCKLLRTSVGFSLETALSKIIEIEYYDETAK